MICQYWDSVGAHYYQYVTPRSAMLTRPCGQVGTYMTMQSPPPVPAIDCSCSGVAAEAEDGHGQTTITLPQNRRSCAAVCVCTDFAEAARWELMATLRQDLEEREPLLGSDRAGHPQPPPAKASDVAPEGTYLRVLSATRSTHPRNCSRASPTRHCGSSSRASSAAISTAASRIRPRTRGARASRRRRSCHSS